MSNQKWLTHRITHKVKVLSSSMADSGATSSTSTPKNDEMSGTEKEFVKVKTRSRKRKLQDEGESKESSMDTSETASKRPNLPPISADKLTVGNVDSVVIR